MKISLHFPAAAALAASLLLAACGSGSDTAADANAAEENAAEAAPVELPPMVTASKTYRCKDNSLVYIDFLNNNTALFRTEKTGTPTQLTAAEAGQPFVAEGYSVSGEGAEVTIASPGKPEQACKA